MKIYQQPFILLLASFLVCGAFFVAFIPKGALELFINTQHHPTPDVFFKYWTHMGDGAWFVILFVAFLFYRYYAAFLTLAVGLFQLLQTFLFKQVIWKGSLRPRMYIPEHFDLDQPLYFIEGVKVHGYNTFPSGHTSSAFSLAFLLTLLFAQQRPWLATVFFTAALLVAFSRVYIMQHFFVDVYVGSVVGTASTLMFWAIFDAQLKKRNTFLQGSILGRRPH